MTGDGAGRAERGRRLRELASLFLKLGTIGFGGPAAHIAMMDQEVVERRRWLDRQAFLDLLGATNLIPGPNSTEMAIHIGYARAGWPGLVVAGASFIFPAMVIVLVIAHLYVRFRTVPEAAWLLYGVKPVVIAVVLQAVWNLGRSALKNRPTAAAAAAVAGLWLLGWHEILLLALAGAAVMVASNWRAARGRMRGLAGWLPLGGGAGAPAGGGIPALAAVLAAAAAPGAAAVAPTLPRLFGFFLKVGAVLYGSGYVLLAFLRADLVERWGWLSPAELLDAIAVGQVTPGPVFTTATFIGYLVAGWPGALLATVGIFLPAFVFVAISHPLIPRLRRSPWAGGFLDGVNAASLALMAVVMAQLARDAVADLFTAALFAASAVALFRYRVNSAWLVAGGAAAAVAARAAGLS